MNPYLLVNGNFVRTNGMDMPNLALAEYLASRGDEVHLVTHYAEAELARHPNVTVHHVLKLANSYLLATPALNAMGRRWAARIFERNGHVVVNGGNCFWGDINWVHYVHAAFRASRAGSWLRELKNAAAHKSFLARERVALGQARILITNSERTKRDVIEYLGIDEGRIHTIYYGIDAEAFRPPTDCERAEARDVMGWLSDKLVVAFVGALGDRRKGFDTLFAAWKKLCAAGSWDVDLTVMGAGVELAAWKSRAVQEGLQGRINFLGFREDVPKVLAACDALVAPTRYEAYGQGVHEALCCGLPAIVSQSAGVAERYPAGLKDLLLVDPESVDDLVSRLLKWRSHEEEYRVVVAAMSRQLRTHTWNDMAAQVVRLVASA